MPAIMEPRMRPRQKGQQFPTADLEAYLVAFGDDRKPLRETVKVLDEIVTDYLIETCHVAAQTAAYNRRAKVKVDDFKFVLRRDTIKLARVGELLRIQREIQAKKRLFDVEEEKVAREQSTGTDKSTTTKAAAARAKDSAATVTSTGKARSVSGLTWSERCNPPVSSSRSAHPDTPSALHPTSGSATWEHSKPTTIRSPRDPPHDPVVPITCAPPPTSDNFQSA